MTRKRDLTVETNERRRARHFVVVVTEDGYGRVPVRTLLRLLGRIAAEG